MAAESYGDNIRRLRERRGWSQAQLAERTGLDASSISMIETGRRNPRAGTVKRLAEALGVYVTEIMGEGAPPPPRAQSFGAFDVVPMVSAAHAGTAVMLQETGSLEYVAAGLSYGGALLACEVMGDCLSPTIEPGDVVLFDTRRRTPQHGELVVVTTEEGELLVRRVVRTPDGAAYLTDRTGALEQPNGTIIQGTVVEIRRRPGRSR